MKRDYLYFIQSDLTGMIKVGRSKDPQKRLKQLQTGNPNRLKLIASFREKGSEEKYLHEVLNNYKQKGEWFSYQCVGSIPDDYYDQLPFGVFDDWWKNE